jgi:hypothetical protein
MLLLIFSIALIVILYMFTGATSDTATASSINPTQPQPSGQLGISAYFIVFFITLIVVAMNYSSITSSYTSVVSSIYSYVTNP